MKTARPAWAKPLSAATFALVEDWSDERAEGNGILVTLHYGHCWASDTGCHVRGFDTLSEARADLRALPTPCDCAECKRYAAK